MQSDKLSKTLMCVFLLAMFVIIADSSDASQKFQQNSLIQSTKTPMTTKCMLDNCLACPQGLPYTCSTCKENATCCSHFCKKCTQQKPTECAECQPGYTYNPQTKNCVLQDSCNQTYCASCVTYDTGRKCQGCMFDSVLIPWTNTCERCPEGCYLCNVEMECLSCDAHYFNNGTGCEQCDNLCEECENAKDYCTSCPVSYYLIEENHTCAQCMDHCASCLTKDQCSVCELYYFYNVKTQKCQMCGQYCLICKSVGQCIKCDHDHYMNQTEKYCNTCDQIIKNCRQCSKPDDFSISNKQTLSQVTCLQCFEGYYISMGKCLPCGSHCIKCQNSMTCLECDMKYVVNPVTRICDQCNIEHCMKCQNATVCLYCQPNYYWNNVTIPQGMCYKCKTGCSGCGINYCYQCDKGYYLNGEECLKCNSECGECERNASNCISCVTGYFLPQNGNKCLKCPQHCSGCMDENNCQSCLVGYKLIGRSCVKCSIQNCGYCSMMNALKGNELTNEQINQTLFGTQICQQCVPGYYMNSQKVCSQCLEHCKLCDDFTICKLCQKGFYFNNKSCLPCIEHCVICQINAETWHSDCMDCETGYYLNQTNKHCQKCSQPNCTRCANNNCYQCAVGFYLKTYGLNCQKCMENCTQCIDGERCLACKEGFWWDVNGWKCVECGDKCKLCVEGGGCVVCRDGYRVGNDRKCEECTVNGCGKCDYDKKQCEQCLVGYVMENKTDDNSELEANLTMICFKCGQQSLLGCRECQSSTKCTNCIQGYQLNANSLCAPEQKTEKVIWPYILIIALLSSILIGLGVFKLKKKIQGKSLSKLMKLQKDSQDPQNYHKLQDLVIN